MSAKRIDDHDWSINIESVAKRMRVDSVESAKRELSQDEIVKAYFMVRHSIERSTPKWKFQRMPELETIRSLLLLGSCLEGIAMGDRKSGWTNESLTCLMPKASIS